MSAPKLRAPEANFRIQSRNRTEVTPDTYCQGMAAALLPLRRQIGALKTLYLERFISLNQSAEVDTSHPLIIASEWIGKGIQKDVGISNLPRSFVIVCASLNGQRLPDASYADLHDEMAGIYNVHSCSPAYRCTFNPQNPAKCEEEIMKPTSAVDAECRFARSFGIERDFREGIVWKGATPWGRADARYWLKTKGPSHSPKSAMDKGAGPEEQKLGRKYKVGAFVRKNVHERRLEQGLGYLHETCVTPEEKATKTFVDWVVGDLVTEEGQAMLREVLDERQVKARATELASRWFKKKLEETTRKL